MFAIQVNDERLVGRSYIAHHTMQPLGTAEPAPTITDQANQELQAFNGQASSNDSSTRCS